MTDTTLVAQDKHRYAGIDYDYNVFTETGGFKYTVFEGKKKVAYGWIGGFDVTIVVHAIESMIESESLGSLATFDRFAMED